MLFKSDLSTANGFIYHYFAFRIFIIGYDFTDGVGTNIAGINVFNAYYIADYIRLDLAALKRKVAVDHCAVNEL